MQRFCRISRSVHHIKRNTPDSNSSSSKHHVCGLLVSLDIWWSGRRRETVMMCNKSLWCSKTGGVVVKWYVFFNNWASGTSWKIFNFASIPLLSYLCAIFTVVIIIHWPLVYLYLVYPHLYQWGRQKLNITTFIKIGFLAGLSYYNSTFWEIRVFADRCQSHVCMFTMDLHPGAG